MKVLKNNYNEVDTKANIKKIEPYPRKLICEECGSELEYEKSDLRMGALGSIYLDCPLCHCDNMLESHEDEITLTKDNIVFPTHFFHTSAETGAVDCCNNESIKEEIHRGIDFLRKNKERFSWMTEYGNLYVYISRYVDDENYAIMVTNDFYSTYIPFEPEDY